MINDNKLTLEELVASGFTVEHLEAYLKVQEMKNKQKAQQGDSRYNVPKEAPMAPEDLIDQTIAETEIYREAKMEIMQAQRKQVGYGLDKYPKPLSADVWDILETVDHIVDESVDKLHYLVMLKIHLKREIVKTRNAQAEADKYKRLYEELKQQTECEHYDVNKDAADALYYSLIDGDTFAKMAATDSDNDGDKVKDDTPKMYDQHGNAYVFSGGALVRVD